MKTGYGLSFHGVGAFRVRGSEMVRDRILIVTCTLGLSQEETSGVATIYRNLLPYFAAEGRSVDLWTYGNRDEIEQAGCVRVVTDH